MSSGSLSREVMIFPDSSMTIMGLANAVAAGAGFTAAGVSSWITGGTTVVVLGGATVSVLTGGLLATGCTFLLQEANTNRQENQRNLFILSILQQIAEKTVPIIASGIFISQKQNCVKRPVQRFAARFYAGLLPYRYHWPALRCQGLPRKGFVFYPRI